jgi:hypothetical protein
MDNREYTLASTEGIHTRVLHLTEDSVVVKTSWLPPYGSNHPEVSNVLLKGPKNVKPEKTTWGPGKDEDTDTFTLDQQHDFFYKIRVRGKTDWVFVPLQPKPKIKQPSMYVGYIHSFPDWNPSEPLCTGTVIPAGVKVIVRITGSSYL